MTAGQWETGRGRRVSPAMVAIALVAAIVVVVTVVAQRPGAEPIPIAVDDDVPPAVEEDVDGPPTGTPLRPTPVVPVAVRLPTGGVAATSCPTGEPVQVIGGEAYPPTHPTIPSGRAEGCYATVTAAIADGYTLGATPRGFVQAGGLYLTRSEAVQRYCARAARHAGHTIPCPHLVPRGGQATSCVATCTSAGGYLLQVQAFTIPGRWCRRCTSDLVIAAAPADAAVAASALTRCSPASSTRRTSHGYRCTPDTGPAGLQPHAGNWIKRGKFKDITYAVSAGGSFDARDVVAAVFNSVRFVDAPPRR